MDIDFQVECGYCHAVHVIPMEAGEYHTWMFHGGTAAEIILSISPAEQQLIDTCYCPDCPHIEL